MVVLVFVMMVMVLFCYLTACSFEHIYFCRRNAAAVYGREFECCADIQRLRGLFKQRAGNTGVHEGAQKHVAADSGKAFKISNSHGSYCHASQRFASASQCFAAQLKTGQRLKRLHFFEIDIRYCPPAFASASTGRISFIEPERYPSQSTAT